MKKKLTLKKEAIVRLESSIMFMYKGGGLTANTDGITFGVNCPDTLNLCLSQTGGGAAWAAGSCNTCGGGARAAGSCGSCGQPTCDGQYSSVPYDCAPTDGGNSCNFPDGCHLPSVGCAQ